MEHLHYEIDAHDQDQVEVSIDRAANVQLLDPTNYELYQQGRSFSYEGGYATVSPVRFTVQRAGRWHVVIDLGGGAGRVKASMRHLSGAVA